MEKVNVNKTVFWNVDTQVDFMNENGKLYVPNAENIKVTLSNITNFANVNNIRVVNTMDWHYEDSEEISDEPNYSETFPPHCIIGTEGCEFIEETKPHDPYIYDWSVNLEITNLPSNRNLIIRKDKFDVFQGNLNTKKIVKCLKNGGIERIYVYGVAGDVCVAYAVENLIELGFEVVLISNAISALNDVSMENSIKAWSKNDNFRIIKFTEDFSI